MFSDAKNVDEIPVLLLVPTEGGANTRRAEKMLFFYTDISQFNSSVTAERVVTVNERN